MAAGEHEAIDQATLEGLIDALYQTAVDPSSWEALVDLLPLLDGPAEPPRAVKRDLIRSLEIARQVGKRVAIHADRTELPVIALDADLRVLSLTPQAERAMPAGAALIGQRLRFANPSNDEFLRQSVERVRRERASTVTRFIGQTDEESIFAYLAEDPKTPGDLKLVFANSASLGSDLRLGLGLTAAETRVANQFRLSGSLPEVAEALGVSVNTARNQLAAVFEKLGISRQSELIRVLTELSALADAIGTAQPPRQPSAPERKSVVLPDGRRMSFRDYGDPSGKVLLAFHEGLGSSLLPFDTGEIAQRIGLRVVCVDRPGFGGSDPVERYSFHDIAEDMAAVCDLLGLAQISIAGLMSGAPSALATALRLGPRVDRVFLCSARPPGGTRLDPINLLSLFRTRLEANSWFAETLYGLLKTRISPELIRRNLLRAVAASPGDKAYLAANPETINLINAYVSDALSGDGKGPAREVGAFRRAANFTLDGLRAPLSIWHGAEDRLTPLDDLLAFVGDQPYELAVMPGIGQLMTLKHWEDLLRAAVQPPPAQS